MKKKETIFVLSPTLRNGNKPYVLSILSFLSKNFNVIFLCPSYSIHFNFKKFVRKTLFFNGNTKLNMFLNIFNFLFLFKLFVLFYKYRNNKSKLLILNGDSYPMTIIISILSLINKIKVFAVIHDVVPHPKNIIDKINNFLRLISFRFFNFFIVHSSYSYSLFKNIYKKNNLFLVNHPSYIFFFNKYNQFKNKVDLRSDFIFFGRADSYKGMDLLANCILELDKKIYKRINFVFIGKGDFFKPIANIKHNLQYVDIKLINNFVSDQLLVNYIVNSNCLILPYTQASQSGVPLVGHFYGLDLIISNKGGLCEFLPINDYVSFDPLKKNDLVNSIINILKVNRFENGKKLRLKWHRNFNRQIENDLFQIFRDL